MGPHQQTNGATIAPDGGCSRERINATLATILASDPFRTTPQCRDLLQRIVTHTLTSEHDLLKERMLGVTVFARKPDYDTASDSIVRVRAADVRKRLAQFYQSDGCLAGMVRIDIPTGGYHATFRMIQHEVSPSGAHLETEVPFETPLEASVKSPVQNLGPSKTGWVRWLQWRLLVPVLVTIAGGGWTVWRLNKHTIFEDFWAPAFASSKAITIYNADNPAFRLRSRIAASGKDNAHLPERFGMDMVPLKQGQTLQASDLIPIQNQLITIGDGYATALLCALFARHDKPFQLKFGSELSFVDLRYSPAILIGAFNNGWTLETTGQLKFVFSDYPSIRERGGQNRVWALSHLGPDGETAEDYAIVSRVVSSDTGQVLIAAAGITQYGTRAAGEFLTTREELEGALRRLPSDWGKRNIQFVLHTQIVRETPGRPAVVASYCW
jgi:hypothetical protein